MPKSNQSYCVVFRVGGTDNFKWHTSLGMSESDADQCLESVTRMGYTAYLKSTLDVLAFGLPKTFENGETICPSE